MAIKRFIFYSIIIHSLGLSLLFFLPYAKKAEKKQEQFFARIISPDEMLSNDKEEKTVPTPPSMPAKPAPGPQVKKTPPPVTKVAPPSKPTESASAPSPTPKAETLKQTQQGGGIETAKEPEKINIPAGTGGYSFPLRMKDLMDEGVIEKFAMKQDEPQEKSSITFDAKEFRYQNYMQRLKEKIEGIWKYPSDAAMRGIYGDLYIVFTIKRDGSLGSVDIKRTSGYKSLDDAAIKALKDAAPYWPLPEDWEQDSLTITGHFVYLLYGMYIR